MKIYTLSATWMQDHLDVWNEAEFGPAPVGTFRRNNTWKGPLTPDQREEVINRAKSYAEPYGPDCDAERYIRAAKRVLAVMEPKQ